MKQKQEVIHRGAHSSAKHQFRQFLWEDMQDMVAKGFWTILPFHVVKLYPHRHVCPSRMGYGYYVANSPTYARERRDSDRQQSATGKLLPIEDNLWLCI